MKRSVLLEQELSEAIARLDGWAIVTGKLQKEYKFASFSRALGWMVSAGIEADKMDHHPEWCNVYNQVTVKLVTHDLDNQISTWDIALAEKFDALA